MLVFNQINVLNLNDIQALHTKHGLIGVELFETQ